MELRAYLSSVNETPSAFAVRVGTSRQNVSRWCSGVMPRRRDIVRILSATGGKVTPTDFALAVPRPAGKNSSPQVAA